MYFSDFFLISWQINYFFTALNTKEISLEIRKRLQIDSETSDALFSSFVNALKEEMLSGNSLSIPSFGIFEARRKKERISINPVTKQRLLSPPKQSLAFKMSAILKDKLNQ